MAARPMVLLFINSLGGVTLRTHVIVTTISHSMNGGWAEPDDVGCYVWNMFIKQLVGGLYSTVVL